MMMSKYDDEIRAVEERLVRERAALADRAERLGQRARDAAASPTGLIVAAALGFLLGELSRPRHHHHHSSAPMPAKIGLGGVLGGVALALMRAQYGSPVGFGRAAWQYAAERRRAARAAEAEAAPAAYTSDPPPESPSATAPAASASDDPITAAIPPASGASTATTHRLSP
jgi:hypothetical protein